MNKNFYFYKKENGVLSFFLCTLFLLGILIILFFHPFSPSGLFEYSFVLALGILYCLYGMRGNYKIYRSPLFPKFYRIWEIFIYPPALIGLILCFFYINFVLRTDFLKLNSLFGGLFLITLFLENFLNTKYDDSEKQIQELHGTYGE